LFSQGASLANLEFVHHIPLCLELAEVFVPVATRLSDMGARLWVDKEGQPWCFLEEDNIFNLNEVPAHILTQVIQKIIVEHGLGCDSLYGGERSAVYLDVRQTDFKKLSMAEQRYYRQVERWAKLNLKEKALAVRPAIDFTLGGLSIDDHFETNLRGVFACGEASCTFLGANVNQGHLFSSMLAEGLMASEAVVEYCERLSRGSDEISEKLFEVEKNRQFEWQREILSQEGLENPYALWDELTFNMRENVGLVRSNGKLKTALEIIDDIGERVNRIHLSPDTQKLGQDLVFTQRLTHCLNLAEAIVISCLYRNESRGCHFKPDYPKKDDQNFLNQSLVYLHDDTVHVRFQKHGQEVA